MGNWIYFNVSKCFIRISLERGTKSIDLPVYGCRLSTVTGNKVVLNLAFYDRYMQFTLHKQIDFHIEIVR